MTGEDERSQSIVEEDNAAVMELSLLPFMSKGGQFIEYWFVRETFFLHQMTLPNPSNSPLEDEYRFLLFFFASCYHLIFFFQLSVHP